ncbi:hypothetical protein [Solwaraspora sp. WMMA2065]|uniref:hypothetical protein n=1 Tax=Solwaraspora sp. WMMA2065 TaxID=3015166 RepID=UPI00259B0F54|nr:hypothetical protein [Solwaraspora sp. WMMA2065]WJK34987.1 hypothetical protein O7610_00810 [Solwaraspora sp. WMMA2065]
MLWKLTGGSAQEFSRNPHSVKQLAFSRDGKAVFTGDQAGRLVRWSLPDGQRPSAVKEQTLGHHLGGASIQAVLPLAGGRWVVTGGDDGAVCCWEAQARTQASEPSAKLVPASIPLRIVEWEGGLLVADRNGGASLLDLVTPVPVDAAEAESAAVAERTPHLELRAATPRTLPAPESLTGRVVLVDQAWLRGQPRADLGRLLAEIGGSTAVGILCCPDVPGLATFRHALASIGYAILDVPVTAAARRRPVVDFLRRLGPRTSPVLITGDQVLIDDLHEAGLAVEIVDDIGPFAFGDR